MRFREFKPLLREFVEPQVTTDLSALDNLEQGLENNPEIAVEILPELKNLLAFVKSNVGTQAQPQAKPVQQAKQVAPVQQQQVPLPKSVQPTVAPVEEAVATAVQDPTEMALRQSLMLLQTLRQLMPSMPKGAKRKQAEDTLIQLEAEVGQVHQTGIAQGKQDILNLQGQWREVELPELSEQLTLKVLGYLQTLKEISDEAVSKGEESPRNAKKAPEKNTIYRQIHDPLEALFAKLADPKVGVSAEEYTQNIAQVKDFMQRCQVGVFDIDTLVRKKVGNIRNLISKEDQRIYDVIFQKLLSLTVSGGGSWGPGEIGLAVLGKPVQKQAGKGDLIVGKKKIPIELKSGADAKAGARLGGDGVVQARAAVGKFIKYFDTFLQGLKIPALPQVEGRPVWRYETDKLKTKKINGVSTRVPSGEKVKKALFATNMSSPVWFDQFNINVLSKLNTAKRKVSAKTFLNTVLKMCLSKDGEAPYEEAVQQFNSIENMLDSNGYINYQQFLKELTKIWYHIYSRTDNVKYILVLNQSNGNFELVGDADALTSNIGTNRDKNTPKGIEIVGGLDFGAGQIQLSPQVGVY